MEDFNVIFSDGGITQDEMGYNGACSLEILFKADLHLSACLTNIARLTARILELVDNNCNFPRKYYYCLFLTIADTQSRLDNFLFIIISLENSQKR